jgi:dTDP-4-amino-4,6-dideoxygalactose transaminase
MEFIDLKAQLKRIEPAMRARMDKVLAHGRFIMGPEIKELEERLAALAGAGHCLTCASGTMALDLVLMAWGIGPGDAVFTTPFTFIATAESIARTGAVPVFADIGADFNLDPAHLERAIEAVAKGDASLYPIPVPARGKTLRPRAVVAVDLFGQPADYVRILPLAHKHGLLVLEDAAQSFGGTYKDRPLCGCGCHAAAASFFPAKPLGCYGDGGAVFTDDAELAALVDSLRYHGRIGPQDKNNNVRLGVNGRLDTLQAAVVLAKLDVFADEVAVRRQVAARYHALCAAIPGITPPAPPVDGLSVWAQYTVLLPEGADRAAVMARMQEVGVPTAVNYPKALHVQEVFRCLGYAADASPVARNATSRVLSLPMHPYLDEAAQQCVASALGAALNA